MENNFAMSVFLFFSNRSFSRPKLIFSLFPPCAEFTARPHMDLWTSWPASQAMTSMGFSVGSLNNGADNETNLGGKAREAREQVELSPHFNVCEGGSVKASHTVWCLLCISFMCVNTLVGST